MAILSVLVAMNRDGFFAGLLAGDQHRGGIRCLSLFRVESDRFDALADEIGRFRRDHRASRVTDRHHVTHWTEPSGRVEQYSLLNRSGRSDDFTSDHDLSCKGKWFFDGASYPALGHWMSDWPHLINVRLHVMWPGASLAAHEEHVPFRTARGTVGARLRFHLPIETNEDAELRVDGLVYHLRAGVVYLVNQGCVHSAANHGYAPRVHLVWDALLTAELHAFLFRPAGAPAYLCALADVEPAPLRAETPGPYRRLPPDVSPAESEALALCQPQ